MKRKQIVAASDFKRRGGVREEGIMLFKMIFPQVVMMMAMMMLVSADGEGK